MARKPDVQYIRFYTDGSAARALDLRKPANRTTLPKVRKNRVTVIRLDPLAMAGILVSAVMLVLMAVSCFRLIDLQQQTDRMDVYVDTLKEENARLEDTYRAGYDLKDVEEKALALGLIPEEEAQRITVSVTVPEETESENSDGWSLLVDVFD